MGLAAAWLFEVGIITVRDFATVKRPPLPSELLATFVVFGLLSVVPAPKATTAAGWGIVIATLLGSKVDVLAPVADFMAGKPVSTPPATVAGSPVLSPFG